MTTITDKQFVDRAHVRYAEKAGLSYEQARACAEATLGVWKDDGCEGTPEDAVDADLECWDNDEGCEA